MQRMVFFTRAGTDQAKKKKKPQNGIVRDFLPNTKFSSN